MSHQNSQLKAAFGFFTLLFLAGCGGETQTSVPVGDERQRLNIIWLVAEDLSAVELGSYGNGAAQTPNLDSLAQEGTRFPNTFSTTPVCAPSRSSFFTGLQTGHCPVRGNYEVPPEGQLPPGQFRADPTATQACQIGSAQQTHMLDLGTAIFDHQQPG